MENGKKPGKPAYIPPRKNMGGRHREAEQRNGTGTDDGTVPS